MDARTSAKRVRADSGGTALLLPSGNANPAAGSSQVSATSVDADTLQAMLDKLPSSWKNGALLQAALKYPDVRQMVFTEMQITEGRENRRIIDFDYHSRSVWKSLNVTYSKLSGSRQFEAAFDVQSSIDSTIETITKQCQRPSSAQTRRNGFEVLRKIGKSILLSGDTLGHEVQKQFGSDHTLEDGMLAILQQMDLDEIVEIRYGNVGGSNELWEKLLELKDLASQHGFDKFNDVIDYLEGDEEAGEYDDQEGEEDEEDEEEEEGYEEGYEEEGEEGEEGEVGEEE
ncbi:hypothetical protein Egran_01207 [Elaphomyces granulatus]|uniref:Uncharacterized protein n=1 Tax=Elaphomyces granulatus TaxID=519963 RepID=A0A232M408_9EURO|nr:hypothetical protein Egran_01207 [Elaphomyces granulatus]